MTKYRVELEMLVNLIDIVEAETEEEAVEKAKARFEYTDILIEDTEELDLINVEEI